jgi:hypothetical protein
VWRGTVMMMWPNAPWDCIACKDGLQKIVLFEDGMGVCVPPTGESCLCREQYSNN